nr:MAG TPA: hypothetical protein [Caudoviricetes sp.]
MYYISNSKFTFVYKLADNLIYYYDIESDSWCRAKISILDLIKKDFDSDNEAKLWYIKSRLNHITIYDDKDEIQRCHELLKSLS